MDISITFSQNYHSNLQVHTGVVPVNKPSAFQVLARFPNCITMPYLACLCITCFLNLQYMDTFITLSQRYQCNLLVNKGVIPEFKSSALLVNFLECDVC